MQAASTNSDSALDGGVCHTVCVVVLLIGAACVMPAFSRVWLFVHTLVVWWQCCLVCWLCPPPPPPSVLFVVLTVRVSCSNTRMLCTPLDCEVAAWRVPVLRHLQGRTTSTRPVIASQPNDGAACVALLKTQASGGVCNDDVGGVGGGGECVGWPGSSGPCKSVLHSFGGCVSTENDFM